MGNVELNRFSCLIGSLCVMTLKDKNVICRFFQVYGQHGILFFLYCPRPELQLTSFEKIWCTTNYFIDREMDTWSNLPYLKCLFYMELKSGLRPLNSPSSYFGLTKMHLFSFVLWKMSDIFKSRENRQYPPYSHYPHSIIF